MRLKALEGAHVDQVILLNWCPDPPNLVGSRLLGISYPSTTSWARTPMGDTATSMRSPACMNTGGLRATPTPPGVPVTITSPGNQFNEG